MSAPHSVGEHAKIGSARPTLADLHDRLAADIRSVDDLATRAALQTVAQIVEQLTWRHGRPRVQPATPIPMPDPE